MLVSILLQPFSKALVPVFILGGLLLIWRLWRFTIRPWIWPSEPKFMPYWIPFFGHFRPFFADCHQLIDDAIAYFGRTSEPFAFQMCGQTIYCFSAPEDVTGILDGVPWTHGMDFSHFISEIMQKFGVTPEDIKKSEYVPKPGDACFIPGNTENPNHLNLIHFVEELYKRQFLEPANLDPLSKVFVKDLQNTLKSRNLGFCINDYSGCSYVDFAEKSTPLAQVEVNLYDLVAGTMVNATLVALFGPYLHEVEPDIVNQVILFNAHAWQLFYGLPDFWGMASVCEPRDRIRKAFRHFIDLPEEERPEQCYAFKNLLRWMDVLDIGKESRVGLLFLFFFASIANEQNACYWFVAHIIYDPQLLSLVQEEMAPAWSPEGKLSVKHLTSQCPTLDAIFNETLRQRTNTFGWRVVKKETVVRGKTLRPGVPVIIPMRILHGNEKAWGKTVEEFDPERFVKKKTLSRQPFYRPFASGPTYCPGRTLAKQETYAFLASLLRRFEVRLLPGDGGEKGEKQRFPLMETFRPPTGVKGPLPGMDLKVELIERMVDEKVL